MKKITDQTNQNGGVVLCLTNIVLKKHPPKRRTNKMKQDRSTRQINKIITVLDNTEGIGREEFTELKYLLEYCKHLLEQKLESHAVQHDS